MTKNEKHRINELRLNGYGYKKIAKELGLSVNTVKSYLARVRLKNRLWKPRIYALTVEIS